ncbi:MAG: methylmalonyl-CoA mutase family protein, partial [Fidelibacterota bacterium]
HILKEESFISKVADPLNGSFIIEMLTKQIINNSWELFLELYDNKGDENKNLMLSKINLIRNIKIQRFLNGKKQLLGINLFKTKKEESNKWELIPKYLDM